MAIITLCVLTIACSNTTANTGNPTSSYPKQLGSQTFRCNEPADMTQQQYIIGYGSLMQQESRQRTAPAAGSALAIDVKGYRRGWFAKGSNTGFSTTFLGAVADNAGSFNAVLFAVNAQDLAAMDKREASYCRSAVPSTAIKATQEGVALPSGQYWIYLNSTASIALASKEKPLVQSYVDIFISGCLEQEEQQQLPGFAQRCINSTTDWSAFWVNDRIYPRRPFIYQPKAWQIDRLLETALPALFNNIILE
jgi:hypothetical protein